MSLLQLHAFTLENVIKLQLITITILITPTLAETDQRLCYSLFWKFHI